MGIQEQNARTTAYIDSRQSSLGATFDPKRSASLNALVQRNGWLRIVKGCTIQGAQRDYSYVVDLGFGHGATTAELAKAHQDANLRVYRLDVSSDMRMRWLEIKSSESLSSAVSETNRDRNARRKWRWYCYEFLLKL